LKVISPIDRLGDEAGNMGSVLGLPRWTRQESVHLRDGEIFGRGKSFPVEVTGAIDADRLLRRFIRLTDAEKVRAFAAEYGFLGVCAHEGRWFVCGGCRTPELPGHRSVESVARWLGLAQNFREVLSVAAALKRDPPLPKDAWAGLAPLWEGSLVWPRGASYNKQIGARRLERIVNAWMEERPASLGVVVDPMRLRLRGRLLEVLVFQVAVAVAGAHELAFCAGCGFPYLRKGRRPKPGQNNWCPEPSCQRLRHRQVQREYVIRQRGDGGPPSIRGRAT
jgi:hypothetical protein